MKISPFKNLINKSKNANIGIIIVLIWCFIVISYISSIIYYLNNLKICSCYQTINKKNFSNLTYLIVIESIILSIHVLIAFFCLIVLINLNLQKGGEKNNNFILYLPIIISLIIYGFFFYYVYKLSENINKNCECSNSNLRYLLYIQCIAMIIGLPVTYYNLIKN
jgi:hypothetical protein